MLLNRRYLGIVYFFGRLTLHVIAWEIVLRRLGLGAWSNRTARERYTRWSGRFRALAVRLGGVMIKVGQFLSARVDVLPEYITAELAGLQDEVPPAPFPAIRAVLEAELGQGLESAFPIFDTAPLAAASLGQTHRAQLPTGERVVVKILRPGIEAVVEIDLAALRTVAQWLRRYPPIARRADVDGLLNEFAATLREELDYRLEAAHAARFAEMFADKPGLRIPQLHRATSAQRVLTLEDVGFIKITDYAGLAAAGVDRGRVARRLFWAYMHQIFDQGFFHADPHPGNLFVQPADGERGWRLVFIDFGMVGVVSPATRAALREAAIGLATGDPARLLRASTDLGAVLPGADLDRILEAERAVFDRFWGKSMTELRQTSYREVDQFSREFRDLLFQLPFQVPENLIYLGRTVSILSGMCTGLDPQFNVFAAIAPFARKLVQEELDGRNLEYWLNQVADLGRRLLAVPGRLDRVLTRLERGELLAPDRVNGRGPKNDDRLAAAVNRLTGGLIFLGLAGLGTLLYLNSQPTLGYWGWALAGLSLLWTLTQR